MQLGLILRVDDAQFRNAVVKLAHIPKGAQTAAIAAVNKTLAKVRTDTLDMVKDTYAIKRNRVIKSMTITKAHKGNFSGWLHTKSPVLPLTAFNYSVKESIAPQKTLTYIEQYDAVRRVRQKVYKIRVQVLRGKWKTLANAFMMKYKNANQYGITSGLKENIAWRENEKRESAWPRWGPSVPVMVSQKKILPVIEMKAQAQLQKEMVRSIQMVIARAKK